MDNIERLLRPPTLESVSRSDAAYQKTIIVLRCRRWWRRCRAAAAGIGCFLLGALAVWCFAPRHEQLAARADVPIIQSESPIDIAEASPIIEESPRRLEQRARTMKGDDRSQLFRRAGDGYLKYGDDVAALRCYRQALDASPTALTIQTDDSWLLMSLKIARQKEKSDVKN